MCGTKRYMTTADKRSTNPHKLVALRSNSLGHDDGYGSDTHYKLKPHGSALDAMARKISIAHLRQQQRIKLKDTKNELGLWRHIFGIIIIIVAGYKQLLITQYRHPLIDCF